MLLITSIVATTVSACSFFDANNKLVETEIVADFLTDGLRSGQSNGEQSLAYKWQAERELKETMMSGITQCLTTRNRPMAKAALEKLQKTDWFGAWDNHCANQVDLNCPIKAGECWAMGVLTCRKNCDAKFLLRGNRGKFKRCIHKQLKLYEKVYPNTVSEQCSVLGQSNEN